MSRTDWHKKVEEVSGAKLIERSHQTRYRNENRVIPHGSIPVDERKVNFFITMKRVFGLKG